MRPIWLLIALLAPNVARAEGWTRLDSAGIEAALIDRALRYEGAWQDFSASGSTRYVTDRESLGRWAARDGQYCSVWPPSDTWACYDVDRSGDGESIRFVAGDGSASVGTYAE